MGMVFVLFATGEPSVADRMAPHAAELAHYRMDQMVPLDDLWTHELEIDWKNVVGDGTSALAENITLDVTKGTMPLRARVTDFAPMNFVSKSWMG